MLESEIGDLSTAFNTGLTLGAFTWGLLVDILGVSKKMCAVPRPNADQSFSENGASTSLASLHRSLAFCLLVRRSYMPQYAVHTWCSRHQHRPIMARYASLRP